MRIQDKERPHGDGAEKFCKPIPIPLQVSACTDESKRTKGRNEKKLDEMRTREQLNVDFSVEFPHVNITDMISDKSLFSGKITGNEVRQFSANMFRKKVVNIVFVYDIEEEKYFFTELK